MGFVKSELAALETEFSVLILGETYPAKVTRGCLYDPKGERLKA